MLNQNEGIWQLVAKAIGYDLSMSLNCLLWLGGGIGRHEGLKIPWAGMPVRVRVPPELQITIK